MDVIRCPSVLRHVACACFRKWVTLLSFRPCMSALHDLGRRLELESVICVPGQPPSGSVGRVTPTEKIAALIAAEGRSVGSLRPEKSLRCAQRRVGRSRRSDPIFLRRAAGRSVGSFCLVQTLRPQIVGTGFPAPLHCTTTLLT